VIAKSDVRHFHNARGDGKVFSFDLLDADNGEIRATCFNNVVDQFYDQIDVGMIVPTNLPLKSLTLPAFIASTGFWPESQKSCICCPSL
jgi:hypothetical protein